MKLEKARIALAWLLLLGCSAPLGAESIESDLDQLVQDTIREFSSFPQAGIAVGVVKDGQVIFARGYGLRDWGAGLPATPTTRFAIGSHAKSFTALGLAIYRDQHPNPNGFDFDFDHQINEYLPEFRFIDEKVTGKLTPADLLSHRSGLARHDGMGAPRHYTRNEIVSRIPFLEMDNRPANGWRGFFSYNNLAVVAAGTIIEALNPGLSWEDYTRQQILNPLGMTATSFSLDGMAGNPEAALGYNRDGSLAPLRDSTNIGPAGSINSNVEDMLKYLQFYLSGGLDPSGHRLITSETLFSLFGLRTLLPGHATMFGVDICFSGVASCFNYYGLGWGLQSHKTTDTHTTTLAYHGGHLGGYYAFMSLLGEKNLGVVVLNNVDHNPAVLALGRAINQYFLVGPGAPPGDPIVFPPLPGIIPAPAPEGPPTTITTFHHPAYGDVQIFSDQANRLYLKYFEMVALILPTTKPDWVVWLPMVSPTEASNNPTKMKIERDPGTGEVVAIYPSFDPNATSRFARQ